MSINCLLRTDYQLLNMIFQQAVLFQLPLKSSSWPDTLLQGHSKEQLPLLVLKSQGFFRPTAFCQQSSWKPPCGTTFRSSFPSRFSCLPASVISVHCLLCAVLLHASPFILWLPLVFSDSVLEICLDGAECWGNPPLTPFLLRTSKQLQQICAGDGSAHM